MCFMIERRNSFVSAWIYLGLFVSNFWLDLGRPNVSWNEKNRYPKSRPSQTVELVYKRKVPRRACQTRAIFMSVYYMSDWPYQKTGTFPVSITVCWNKNPALIYVTYLSCNYDSRYNFKLYIYCYAFYLFQNYSLSILSTINQRGKWFLCFSKIVFLFLYTEYR